MGRKNKGVVLAKVNLPLYSVQAFTERHILVSGGGGQAKTGVPNRVEIYELQNSGSGCEAKCVTQYDTGSYAIMNCTAIVDNKHYSLAAGMDEMCHIYQMKYKVLNNGETELPPHSHDKETPAESSVRRRTRSTSSQGEPLDNAPNKEEIDPDTTEYQTTSTEGLGDRNHNFVVPEIGFDIRPVESFQTVFGKPGDSFQKSVRYCPSQNLLVTAGSDGHVRVWKYPALTKLVDIEAHKNEVDDIDVMPDGSKIVSISRDGHGYVWNSKDGSLVVELKYAFPVKCEEKYTFRGCRFGIVENNYGNVRLFTILNPAVRKKPPAPAYIFKWNTKQFCVEKMQNAGTDMLSALAVSDDGRFLGIGSLTGSVDVYISFSLQRLYHMPNAHNIFVTGVEFLKTCEETRLITEDQDTSLLSISVDNKILIHHIPKPATMGVVTLVALFIGVLLIANILMDYFQL